MKAKHMKSYNETKRHLQRYLKRKCIPSQTAEHGPCETHQTTVRIIATQSYINCELQRGYGMATDTIW